MLLIILGQDIWPEGTVTGAGTDTGTGSGTERRKPAEASLIIPSQDILLDGAVTGNGTESDAGTETEPRNGSGTERGVRNYLRSGHFIWQCCNDAL